MIAVILFFLALMAGLLVGEKLAERVVVNRRSGEPGNRRGGGKDGGSS